MPRFHVHSALTRLSDRRTCIVGACSLIGAIVVAFSFIACETAAAEPADLSTAEIAAYGLGFSVGNDMKPLLAVRMDRKAFVAGIRDAANRADFEGRDDELQAASYVSGYELARRLQVHVPQCTCCNPRDALAQGFEDALYDARCRITQEEFRDALDALGSARK